jgi:hypothetical protein
MDGVQLELQRGLQEQEEVDGVQRVDGLLQQLGPRIIVQRVPQQLQE